MTVQPSRRRPLRRVLLAALALAAPAVVATGGAGTAPPARAADGDPPFTLSVPEFREVGTYGRRVWDDLGIRLVAGDEPVEVWLQRHSYDEKITVTWKDPTGDPAGDVVVGEDYSSFTRLRRFLILDFDPVGRTPGKPFRVVKHGCLGGDSQRVRPDAPPTSPYPRFCGYGFNPFATGAVQGLQAGHAGTAFNPYSGLRIQPGRYDVTVRLGTRWADAFGIPAAERRAVQRLVVKRLSEGDARTQRTQRSRGGDPSPTPSAVRPRPAAAVAPSKLPDDTPLPDLRALPAWGMQISPNGNYLQFSATVWNAGRSPLVVDGFRRPDELYMDAYQYFFDADGTQRPEYVAVGGFEWDPKPTHLHWHFQSFARYTLVPKGHDPDHGGDHHSRSRKEAFCLAPTDAVDLTVDGADLDNEEVDLSTACGDRDSRAIREVLQSGWGDTYAQFRAGQSFNLKGLPNGCYDVVVEGNPRIGPEGRRILVESDYTNNRWKRTVCIGGTEGARRIRRIAPVGIITEGAVGR